MTKRINYKFHAEEIRKEVKKGRGVVNIVLPENASFLEKIKYELCQKILVYQQDNHLTCEETAQKLGLSLSQTIEILRGNTAAFAIDSLINYVDNLHIPFEIKITNQSEIRCDL